MNCAKSRLSCPEPSELARAGATARAATGWRSATHCDDKASLRLAHVFYQLRSLGVSLRTNNKFTRPSLSEIDVLPAMPPDQGCPIQSERSGRGEDGG